MTPNIRQRLFHLISALLYMGPLLAGLAGAGWNMIPVFAFIFLFWQIVIYPETLPRNVKDLGNPRAIARFFGILTIQVLLLVFCFGVARGIGGTMGTLAQIPVWVPPLLSFLAIPLARLVWDPATDRDGKIGTATLMTVVTDLESAADCVSGHFEELRSLSEDASDAEILEVLVPATSALQAAAVLRLLAAPNDGDHHAPLLRRAFILHATTPKVAQEVLGCGQLAQALEVAGEDAPRLILFAERTHALLGVQGSALMDTPSTTRIRTLAMRHPKAAPALHLLVDRMHMIAASAEAAA